MKMKVDKYFNGNVKLIFSKKFIDKRGFFSEIYQDSEMKALGINNKFIQENMAFSINSGTIRGLHFQKPPYDQAKLIKVIKGKILDVVVDLRKCSNTFGQVKKFILSDNKEEQLYISSGFAHGYKTLCNNVKIIYKVDKYYSPKHEVVLLWSDKKLNIDWEIKNKKIFLSKKDQYGLNFNDFKSPFN